MTANSAEKIVLRLISVTHCGNDNVPHIAVACDRTRIGM